MKKKEDEGKDRAWFLEKSLDEIEAQHQKEVKEEHTEWKKRSHDLEEQEKEKTHEFSKKVMKDKGGQEEKHKREKMTGGVRGKQHPDKKMDRKGRMEKS